MWRTGDRVRQDEDGYLWFEGRTDDVIISSGYRIGPFEVESALVSHPAVAEAAAVAAPDEERGSVVRAVVVLRDGHEPGDALARELQEHVKAETAPYKYPRIVEFADELPKTASGKIKRAELRDEPERAILLVRAGAPSGVIAARVADRRRSMPRQESAPTCDDAPATRPSTWETELDSRGWDTCVVVGDELGGSSGLVAVAKRAPGPGRRARAWPRLPLRSRTHARPTSSRRSGTPTSRSPAWTTAHLRARSRR